MKEIACEYLNQNRLKNADMLHLIHAPDAMIRYADGDGVLISCDGMYFLSADAPRANALLPLLDGAELIVLHEDALLDALTRKDGAYTPMMDCYHAVYEKTERVAYAVPDGVTLQKLDLCDAAFVHAHYHAVDDIDYICERIRAGMYGAFVDGACAGFIGTHVEGTMGLLEILPEYRRRGLAYALEAHMINRLLERGVTPFCQVEIHNEASLALQRKLGMTCSKDTLHWLARREEKTAGI